MMREIVQDDTEENWAIIFQKNRDEPRNKTFALPSCEEIAGIWRTSDMESEESNLEKDLVIFLR